MKHLRGYTKRYFSLAAIAIYSTMNKLCTIDVNRRYHEHAYKIEEYKTSPPCRSIES